MLKSESASLSKQEELKQAVNDTDEKLLNEVES